MSANVAAISRMAAKLVPSYLSNTRPLRYRTASPPYETICVWSEDKKRLFVQILKFQIFSVAVLQII
jgi:hypothetical protein